MVSLVFLLVCALLIIGCGKATPAPTTPAPTTPAPAPAPTVSKFGGTLRSMGPTELGAAVMPKVLARTGVKPEQVDLILLGHCRPAGLGGDSARVAALKGGMPVDVPVVTVQMACVSAMQAVMLGIQAIRLGDANVVVAGGMESMSSACFLLGPEARWGLRHGAVTLVDELFIVALSVSEGWDRLRKTWQRDMG
jgi:acetyl-CoA C-acetyltransferase